jgi:hypothetical protein
MTDTNQVVIGPITVNYYINQIACAPPSPTATAAFILSNAEVTYTMKYFVQMPLIGLSQNVNDGMSVVEKRAQIAANFLTLTRSEFENYAQQVRNMLASQEQQALLAGGESVVAPMSLGVLDAPEMLELMSGYAGRKEGVKGRA